MLHIHLLHI